MAELDKFFKALNKFGGSDLHLSCGGPPSIRLHGEMAPLNVPAIPPEQIQRQMLMEIVPGAAIKAGYLATGDADFAYELVGVARFRCNVFRDRHGLPVGCSASFPPIS